MADDIDSDEDSVVSLPAWEEEEYNDLMAQLRGNENGSRIKIYREVLEYILNEGKMDEFCDAICFASSLESLDIGHSYPFPEEEDDETPLPTLEVTPENSEALDKLFEAVHFIRNRLKWLHLRFVGKISSAILCQILLYASNKSLYLDLEVPWHCTTDRDMNLLVKTVHNVVFEMMEVSFVGTNDSQERHVDGKRSNRLHDDDLLWRLFRLQMTVHMTFRRIDFTTAGCQCIEEILLSKRYESVDFVKIDRCTFPTDGGKLITSAIGKSSSLHEVTLVDVFGDDDFCQDLIQNMPLSSSLDCLTIGFGTDDSIEKKKTFLTNLLMAVMKKNSKELETINLLLPKSAQLLNEEHQLELLPFLQRNYNLKEIEIDNEPSPVFETILRLNRARRRYLIEDSAFPNSCIKVLGNVNVNGHLDSLFFHLRENPILFTCTADDEKEQDVECGCSRQIL